MPRGFLRILWHKGLKLRLGAIVVERSRPGFSLQIGKLRPGIGAAHVENSDRLESRLGRLDPEEVRRLATFDTTPKLPFRGQQQVLVERVGMNCQFNPFAAAGD